MVVAAFLHGVVVGIAAFAFWAQYSGVMHANPIFLILLAAGAVIASGVASLPLWVGERIAVNHRLKAIDDQRRALAQLGHAEQSDGAESR